jgi:molybdenum cofactor cytidylyltransferase
MNLAAIILAAGASRRMGTPKALLDWKGQPFLDHLIALYADTCDPVIAVLGHHAPEIRAAVRQANRACFVENPDPDRGMLSSLQCGLRALPADVEGFLFTPVDQPAVPRAVPANLAALLEQGALIAVPRYQGRRGHPVACAARLKLEFLDHPVNGTPRDIVARHRDQTRSLDVADAGVVEDVDYPQDYERLVAAARPK